MQVIHQFSSQLLQLLAVVVTPRVELGETLEVVVELELLLGHSVGREVAGETDGLDIDLGAEEGLQAT